MNLEQLNMICMEMISNAGEGRALIFEAMKEMLSGNYENAKKKLSEAEELLSEAHRIQFEELMSPQNKGVELPFSMLLLHAMDLTMISTSEHDMLHTILVSRMGDDEEKYNKKLLEKEI